MRLCAGCEEQEEEEEVLAAPWGARMGTGALVPCPRAALVGADAAALGHQTLLGAGATVSPVPNRGWVPVGAMLCRVLRGRPSPCELPGADVCAGGMRPAPALLLCFGVAW